MTPLVQLHWLLISFWVLFKVLASSSFQECLICGAETADCTGQASKQMTACDRILRACIHKFGEGLDCPAHLRHLQALAEMAYHGYTAARHQYVPLYLERLLHHLLRGVAARGPSDMCLKSAQLLYTELLKYQPPQVPADDYTSIAKSTFSVLWKSTDVMGKADKTPADFRAVLSTQLQAVCFLVLLQHDVPSTLLQEPPFFTSLVAQHAFAAAVVFEAQRSPLSREEARFLSEQFSHRLVAAFLERKRGNEPLTFQDCLCIFELMVIRSRYLCKSCCFREGMEVLQQSAGYLKQNCFRAALDVLSAGVELHRGLALAKDSVGPLFIQAAEALNYSVDAQEALLRVLAESCQLLITPLYGNAKKDKQSLFNLEDILGISAFMKSYFRLLQKLLDLVRGWFVICGGFSAMGCELALDVLAFTSEASLCISQGPRSACLPQLLVSIRSTVAWMLEMLEDVPVREWSEYLDLSAYCVSRLAYSFYFHKMYEESNSIVELFCSWLSKEELFKYPDLPTEKLHNCFKIQVENYRKLGLLEEALQSVVLWLASYCSKIPEQMAEPISSWVKVKMDANKSGADDLKLKTLKEGLEGFDLDSEILMAVLLEELKAYKSVRVDTGQERFNVICDLLDICSEGSSWVHERAVILVELAQVLCYHDYSEQTECSALDSIHEALRLLDSVPQTPQNEVQLQDDKAQALLWLYICTIEDKMHKGIEQEQRARNAQGQNDTHVLEGFETNDLGYEDKSHDDKFLYLGIAFNLSADSVQSKCLDDALALWKQLLSKGGIPAVRSIEQTRASLHIMAALYRVMGKPLKAMESYFLIKALCDALQDSIGKTSALCHVAKLLLQLDCPSYAETILMEAEFCLQHLDQHSDSCLLMNQTLAVLRSELCLANCKVMCGFGLLVETLQNPALQRSSKVWYLLRASTLQLTATYLGLPPSTLPLVLRQKLHSQGWKTPERALSDAHKLYRSIILNFSLINCDTAKEVAEHQFVDHGDNLVQKWQVLADMFICSESFVSLLSQIEVISEAKAVCLETLKISMKLQSIRWCARFLVLKSGLELQCNKQELCRSDLDQALFLLESGTENKVDVKIRPKKRGLKEKKPQGQCFYPSEEPPFLKEFSLEFVDTVSMQKETSLSTSPVLRPEQKKRPSFLMHLDTCCCLLCSDVVLLGVCLCWLVTDAEMELAFGDKGEGLHLLECSLSRCTAAALRISDMLACVSQGKGKEAVVQPQSTVKLFDHLVARIYVALAKQGLYTRRPKKQLWKLLETGLNFLSSKGPQLPGLKYQRAWLLLAKAVATISVLASRQDSCLKNIFSSAWSWKSPLSLEGSQENKLTVAKTTLDALYSEVPIIVLGPPPSFVVFEESSPKVKAELLKAPKVTRRMKSRIKVTGKTNRNRFPSLPPLLSLCVSANVHVWTERWCVCVCTHAHSCRSVFHRKLTQSNLAKTDGCNASFSADCSQEAKTKTCQVQNEHTGGEEEEEEEEDKEILRTIEEELDACFESMWVSNEGKAFKGKFGSYHSPVAPVAGFLTMDSVYDSLQAAFHSISHYPPGALYSHICQLMALCTGSRDPIATAYLVSESVSITLRHQIVPMIHRKLNKMKKVSVANTAKQLEALSLQKGKADSRLQYLSELQNLFEFSCPSLPKLETENFRKQLQQIPHGVRVCILSLVSIQPEAVGDILLLTRLEKDTAPVTLQIQTAHSKAPLSTVLGELDAILQKQKETSNFTEKKDWWTGRIALDQRMKALTESLEMNVLSCWRGALLPACEDPSLAKEASHLQTCLRKCGCKDVDLALLKVMLTGSHLLTTQDVQCLVQGLSPAQPERAQNLLQEVVDRLRSWTSQASSGHLVLMLDKHLQKLPWENIPCLKDQSVTRLPSLRFLLGSSLTKKYQQETILNNGVNRSSTFYVLNPHRNLPRTETMFKDWFQSEPGWTGVVGETPCADQVPLALEERDLYIYAGHGAGARFVDSILKVDCRAVTLLFGCSSAALAVQGNLEGTGAVLRFIMAGCPLVLGNLWDVTDRDIDRYMEALLKSWLDAGSGAPLLHSVIQSRQAPKLRYMIGAAPIAYGLPVHLK
uniref:separase n=1 Tax=Varanus komodoensis TaxID=61221 RepID=A0A8D2J4E5_VARKO